LRQAIDRGILTVSIDSARAAVKRDKEFPEPVGNQGQAKLYDEEALRKWQRNRVRVSV